MNRYVLMVFAVPEMGEEAAFNNFYDTIHLPEMLQTEGVTTARRYRVVRGPDGVSLPSEYLNVYDIEGDLQTVQEAIVQGRSARTPIPPCVTKVSSFWLEPPTS
jgi:hypothetical protein